MVSSPFCQHTKLSAMVNTPPDACAWSTISPTSLSMQLTMQLKSCSANLMIQLSHELIVDNEIKYEDHNILTMDMFKAHIKLIHELQPLSMTTQQLWLQK